MIRLNSDKLICAVFLTIMTLAAGCEKIENPPETPRSNSWTWTGNTSNTAILNSFATPLELYFISNDEFFRINAQLSLIEKRLLNTNTGVYGRPSLSFNTFARVTKHTSGRYQLEFHLTKNATEIISVSMDTLPSEFGESLQVDFMAREIGAFSSDGSLFMLPAITFPGYHYVFFIFEIKLDATTLQFDKIQLLKRVELRAMSSEFNNLSSIRYFDGYFFVAAKEGGFRISTDGEVLQFSDKWIKDFFKRDGKIYATGFEDSDFYISGDQGRSWTNASFASPLKIVTAAGPYLFSQEVQGHIYQFTESDFTVLKPLNINEDFPKFNGAYHSISFFAGQYYLAVDKTLYVSQKIE